MKTSVTVLFTVLFLVVAVFYVFFGTPLPKPEAPLLSGGDAKLLPFDSEDPIRLIQIQKPNQKETITLELTEKGWYLKFPAAYPADKMMADGLLSALKISTKARRLLREKGWEEYGLARPDLKIGIEAVDGKKRNYLLLGDKSPVAEMVYARWEGEQEYFLLDARLKMAFDRSAYSLREKKAIRIPPQKIDRIRVQTPLGAYELYAQNRKWFWTEPVSLIGHKITDQEAYQLLMILGELHIKEFLDSTRVELSAQGFSQSSPSIQVWEKDRTTVLRFGKELIAQDSYYAMLEEERVLFLISKENARDIFKIFDGIEEQMPPVSENKPVDLKAMNEKALPSPSPAVSAGPSPSAKPSLKA